MLLGEVFSVYAALLDPQSLHSYLKKCRRQKLLKLKKPCA
jgi:hypothetical protein